MVLDVITNVLKVFFTSIFSAEISEMIAVQSICRSAALFCLRPHYSLLQRWNELTEPRSHYGIQSIRTTIFIGKSNLWRSSIFGFPMSEEISFQRCYSSYSMLLGEERLMRFIGLTFRDCNTQLSYCIPIQDSIQREVRCYALICHAHVLYPENLSANTHSSHLHVVLQEFCAKYLFP
jgi:hypothetical protein